jgi:uncharacterized membrane protein
VAADRVATASLGSGTARPRRGGYAALVWSILGLLDSVYLTIEHFSSQAILACPESSTINCAKVTTSKWSHVLGIPVAVLGLVYFVAMVAICSPPAWRVAALTWVRVAAAGVGALSVIYLIYIELFRVDAICIWCTGVHICTIAALAAILWQTLQPAPGPALDA